MNNEQVLRQNIDDAIKVLAPKFGIDGSLLSSFKYPSIELIQDGAQVGEVVHFANGMYGFLDNKIKIETGKLDNLEIIGEEVSHYLHHQLNPSLNKRITEFGTDRSEFWAGIELKEIIGAYGRIVYSVHKGNAFEPMTSQTHLDTQATGIINQLVNSAHELGYRRADKAYLIYKDEFLPRLARMSLDEAIMLLPRLLPITFYERRVLPLRDRLMGFSASSIK
jgi:hypothetical protein